MNTIETINICDVSLLAGTQVRTSTDEVAVIKYHEAMEEAGTNTMFPPIIVYRDTTGSLWIADGHHRVQASIRSHLTTIVAEVREGEKADAIREAVLANRHNGVPLSKADRFKAMEMLLEISPELTDGALAELLGMPRQTVNGWRKQCQVAEIGNLPSRVGKDGKTYPAKNPRKSTPDQTTSPHDEVEVRVDKKPKPPCSPVSPTVAQPTETTTASQDSHTAQTRDDHDAAVNKMWNAIIAEMRPMAPKFSEFREFAGEGFYRNIIQELFDI